ncbi:hypothetical protein IW261DRAFT_1528228 [Armillaria novae-zelandiae]|uniref:Uncharacterized protein n=1 Tax=Armillaria novae-zelandiae TaxID=153914 RepID=A0AA39NAU2_9AGAR|nr:hypothetical protein IW261DRAFT_1528228 [Armillaria novae-zelandiae]
MSANSSRTPASSSMSLHTQCRRGMTIGKISSSVGFLGVVVSFAAERACMFVLACHGPAVFVAIVSNAVSFAALFVLPSSTSKAQPRAHLSLWVLEETVFI